mmetsp:Transcript_27859/g.65027  ORF Transcript_27859/g.65027 Transcript_27859/m.65027 type:complete len:319 (-) Transcript_27859:330-1286(-)
MTGDKRVTTTVPTTTVLTTLGTRSQHGTATRSQYGTPSMQLALMLCPAAAAISARTDARRPARRRVRRAATGEARRLRAVCRYTRSAPEGHASACRTRSTSAAAGRSRRTGSRRRPRCPLTTWSTVIRRRRVPCVARRGAGCSRSWGRGLPTARWVRRVCAASRPGEACSRSKAAAAASRRRRGRSTRAAWASRPFCHGRWHSTLCVLARQSSRRECRSIRAVLGRRCSRCALLTASLTSASAAAAAVAGWRLWPWTIASRHSHPCLWWRLLPTRIPLADSRRRSSLSPSRCCGGRTREMRSPRRASSRSSRRRQTRW